MHFSRRILSTLKNKTRFFMSGSQSNFPLKFQLNFRCAAAVLVALFALAALSCGSAKKTQSQQANGQTAGQTTGQTTDQSVQVGPSQAAGAAENSAPADASANTQNGAQSSQNNSGQSSRPQGPFGSRTRTVIRISATTIAPLPINKVITVGARVQSSSIANIKPNAAGIVTSIRVTEGEAVKKGAALLYVDSSVAGKRYRPNPVTAPINGVVSLIAVSAGNKVLPSTVVATVIDPSKNKVYADIPERYAPEVRLGAQGALRLIDTEDAPLPVRISEISPQVDKQRGLLGVVLAFEAGGAQAAQKIVSGTFGSLRLTLGTYENQIVVPRRSIVLRKNAQGVTVPGLFVVSNPSAEQSTVSFRPVQTGIEDEDVLQVLEGVAEGEVIVTLGQTHLADGDPAVVLEQDGKLRAESGAALNAATTSSPAAAQ